MGADGPDAVVVGAGLAGASCAAALHERGYDVCVLEASDRPGGRVRTETVDGFRCDVGFQLLNPAYPAVRQRVDTERLRLRTFDPGVAVAGRDDPSVLLLPWRRPGAVPEVLRSGLVRPGEALRLAAWTAPALGPVDRLLAGRDVSLGQSWARARVRGPLRRQVLEPFLTGVLATEPSATSATYVRLLLRSFLRAAPGVPEEGMGALAAQVAEPVRDRIRLGTRARAVRADGAMLRVRTDDGEVAARAAVVATDPVVAGELTGLTAPAMNGLCTWWFDVAEPPATERLLFVDGGGTAAGPVVNTAVMTNVAPSYAPPGRHLVQASTLLAGPSAGPSGGPSEAEVRAQLARMYGVGTGSWQVVARHEVPAALPAMPPPLVVRRQVDLGDGLFVAGDHRDTASIQGALVSGRRAARAVAAYLG